MMQELRILGFFPIKPIFTLLLKGSLLKIFFSLTKNALVFFKPSSGSNY